MRRLLHVGQGMPPRLRWYALAVSAAGVPIVAWAAVVALGSAPTASSALGVVVFFCFALLAELRPVPVDPAGKRLVSLAFVFVIASQLLFGWEWSVLIGAGGIAVAMVSADAAPLKVLFNSSMYAIAAALAVIPDALAHTTRSTGYASLVASVALCGVVFVLVNVLLVCLAIGLQTGGSVRATFVDHLRHSGPIFGIMVFVAVQAVIFWQLSAPLVLLLSAPLFALTLYQRSYVRSRTAEAAASTDSLTGLKNRRAFEDDASRAIEASDARVALCLIDIDHFKQVNDRHGHQAGDAVLRLLARAIDELAPGRSYRLGGDELAFLVPGDGRNAEAIADAIRGRFAAGRPDLVPEPVTLSAGIAVYPEHADDPHALTKRADLALYQSKNNGRSRSTIFTAQEHGPASTELIGTRFPVADSRLATARRLASLVDALADASTDAKGRLADPDYTEVLDRWASVAGTHSEAVADLCVALGRRLGLSGDELDAVRLAGLLHDVGKIAVPASILSTPGPLSGTERDLVERHPVIGYELLHDLGLSPVDEYVLHHHERWDGTGYPSGLAGAEIPVGARLVLVADAFDALTSDRTYRNRVSVEAAMHELEAESGRQFDPLIVSALRDHLAQRPAEASPTELDAPELAWSPA